MIVQHLSNTGITSSAMLHPNIVGLYDRMAHGYNARHRRWLRYAGGEAQAALEAAVRALATPATRLLDAGCGTGTFARALVGEGVPLSQITLLDTSRAMLDKCVGVPASHVQGRLEQLPFDDGAFDLVTCAWAVETTPDPAQALSELCRVVSVGGTLCLAFCAEKPAGDPAAWFLRQVVQRQGAGRFLMPEVVAHWLAKDPDFEIRAIPCRGPAAALIARRR